MSDVTPTVRRERPVQPFPFERLPVTTRLDADARRRVRRFARARVDVARLRESAEAILRTSVQVSLFRITRAELRGESDAVGVMLSVPGERSAAQRVLFELEGALAGRLVARVIDQKGAAVNDPSRSAVPAVAGAAAAVLVAILRRAHAGVPVQAVAAGPAHAIARDFAAAVAAAPAYLAPRAATSVPATTAWLSAVVGDEAFDLRVTIPDDADAVDARPSMSVLAGLDRTPIALPLVAATCAVSTEELARLEVGDAFLPPNLRLDGPVALVAPRAERGIGGNLADGGRLVIGDIEEHPWVMPESPESRTDVLVDAPVVVRVELGAVEMSARAWSELAPGDVLSLGRKVGDPAVLRLGGVEVARGELVQIDGEYGVRILARSKDGT